MLSRLKTWYAKPDNELLRREVAWALAWPLEQWGWAWLLGYLAFFIAGSLIQLSLAAQGVMPLPLSVPGGWLAPNLIGQVYNSSFLLGSQIYVFIMWVFLLRYRVFSHFRRDRLHDLLLSPELIPRLWPAVFVAPVVVLFYFDLALLPSGWLIRVIAESLGISPPPGAIEMNPIALRVTWLSTQLVRAIGFTTFAVLVAVPWCTVPRAIGAAALLWSFYYWASVLLEELATDWLNVHRVGANPWYHLVFFFVQLALTAIIVAISLFLLRRRRIEDLARELLEADAKAG